MKTLGKAVAGAVLAAATVMVPLSAQAIAAPPLPSTSATASGAPSFDGGGSHTRDGGSREFRGDSDRRDYRHDDRDDRDDRWRRYDDRDNRWHRHDDRDDRWRRHGHWYRCDWDYDRDRDRRYHHRHPAWNWDCSPYWRR
ncbi:hypothetical protein ABZ464_27760 [Streptomyces sp. NPDC005820]|uniref:hypothetical protein n=1 Tax=Streptomyces sp. NPDC005820 TaxID=3157069 RepID=UPI0033C89340